MDDFWENDTDFERLAASNVSRQANLTVSWNFFLNFERNNDNFHRTSAYFPPSFFHPSFSSQITLYAIVINQHLSD